MGTNHDPELTNAPSLIFAPSEDVHRANWKLQKMASEDLACKAPGLEGVLPVPATRGGALIDRTYRRNPETWYTITAK